MKSTTETLSPTRVKLTIEVPFDEFKPELDRAYKNIGGMVQVPGFRKGKVPAAVIDQRLGRSTVLDEALNAAIPGWYQQAIVDAKLTPLSQPAPDLTKFADGEDIEVAFELDVVPPIEVPDASTIAVTVADAEVSDAEVDEQIAALRERFATQVPVERAAAEGDVVTIDLVASHKDGTAIPDARVEGMPFRIGSTEALDGLDEAVSGLSAGEETSFVTTLVGGELKGTEVEASVKVTEVKELELPDLDDDFAAMLEKDTLEELRADLRDRLTRGKRMEQAAEARDLVLEEVIDRLDVPLPDGLLDNEVNARKEQILSQLAYEGRTLDAYLEGEGQTREEFDADLERRTLNAVLTQFLLDQVVKDGDIQMEGDELSQHIIRRAQQEGIEPAVFIKAVTEHNQLPELVNEVVRAKALMSLVEAAQVTDKSGNPIDLAALRSDGRTAEEVEAASAALQAEAAAAHAAAIAEDDHDHDHDHDHK